MKRQPETAAFFIARPYLRCRTWWCRSQAL